MEIGDTYFVVQRASVGAKPGMSNLPYDQFPEIPRPIMPAGENNTMDARILLMLNMVTPEDLVDDQEYGVFTKMSKESFRYGAVEDLRIPQPVKEDKTNLRLEAQPSSLPSTHSTQTKLLVSAGCTSSSWMR